MHLVLLEVTTPGWRVDPQRVHKALNDGATRTDRLQHAYLEAQDGRVTLLLYLHALDAEEAIQLAGQLGRRSMAAVSVDRRWYLAGMRTLT